MLTYLLPLALALPVLVAAAANPATNSAVPVAKIQAMLAKPKVMCGRFDQSKTLAGMKKPLAANGRFCVVQEKGVLWRTLQPFPNTLRLTKGEIVHYQGERVAMRLDAKTEPTVRMINQVLFSLLAGDLAQLEQLFKVDGTVGADSWKVTLEAREPALAKAIGTIRLDGGAYVNNIVISEASGDRTSIVFSKIESGDKAMTADEAALF
ncbi:outer membrane lipoprotein carrier protein LolA [Pseudoduganella albidiflava]|uniref:Outer membrane lipoprotein carrier protein LolA n=2 Tax=Pseudoduganella albidiflava TaxID=321983 RepID=A0ABX5RP94_9BURK|nr:outer membrane lipoprotein carrier protein LolA [Pseudoduganella albidiflava]QBI00389.1 outer membrane lipoprotein carrier protein LolA [Pseudoduganella albidiflava]